MRSTAIVDKDKFVHKNCGRDVEITYREKDLDGDGVRRIDWSGPDVFCESCGPIDRGEAEKVI